MLYQLYELQHAAFQPLRYFADQGQHILRSPYNPLAYSPAGRVMAAACEMIEHTTRRYCKPEFGIDQVEIQGRKAVVTEEVVHRKIFGQLRHFKRRGSDKDPRLLIVSPLSGHFATLLRGTVREMLPDHDIYITDWRDARDVPLYQGTFDLDDYIDYVIEWLEALGPDTHIMAVCQPAVPVFAAVSIMEAEKNPAAPHTMTLMGGPIDTRVNPTAVNEVATEQPLEWFQQNVITHVPAPNPGFMRRVYPGFLQLAGFMSMNLGDHMVRHKEMFDHLVAGDGESAEASMAFYEEYRAVMDLTEEFYLQTVKTVFQDQALPRGEMVSRDRKVDPSKITRCALMTIEGERDDISGIGQTEAAHTLATKLPKAKKRHYLVPGAGHYGIFNGRRWREKTAPKVKAFIAKHHQ